LRSILGATKLTEQNFLDWYQNVRIVLKQEKMLYVLQNLISFVLDQDTDNKVRTNYQCHIDVDEEATSVMLANMSFKLQTQHGNKNVHLINHASQRVV